MSTRYRANAAGTAAREREAEALLRRTRDAIIRRHGRGPMGETTIDTEGRKLFGARWGGVGDQRIGETLEPGKYYIVNTSYTDGSAGVHWVALSVGRTGTLHHYDSYARSGARILSRLAHAVRKNGGRPRFVDSDRSDREQMHNSAVCGHLALAWLVVVRDLGIRQALLV